MVPANPNEAAAAGVSVLQAAIARLDTLKQQPGSDTIAIDAQIELLQVQQAALRDQALRTIEASGADEQAVEALNAAVVSLHAAAAGMQDADSASLTRLVTTAGSLLATLARFA